MFRVTFTGHLGADPERRHTASGQPVVNFRVAVNTWVPGADGQQGSERTDWLRVTCFGQLADRAARLTKGSRIAVDGRLRVSEWKDREGKERTQLEVIADECESLTPLAAEAPTPGPGTTPYEQRRVGAATIEDEEGPPF